MSLHTDGELEIMIEDNGKGMPEQIANKMNQWKFTDSGDKNQIGLRNALYRIHLYYGDKADIVIKSREEEFTRVQIKIPVTVEDAEL